MDPKTISDFGQEWQRFDQGPGRSDDVPAFFEAYFRAFPWERVGTQSVGFDAGCGSGRWARLVAPRVGRLVCIDGSSQALLVARRNLDDLSCQFVQADVERLPLAAQSMDFGYCLGVLHHTSDPQAGLDACARLLKPGAPFLVYLYYALEDRPHWYRALWRASDLARRRISHLPHRLKFVMGDTAAALVYWPLARLARAAERLGVEVSSLPLAAYRNASFYTMRTDALDRLGTRVEQRFTARQINTMLALAGFVHIETWGPPYWCALGIRAPSAASTETLT